MTDGQLKIKEVSAGLFKEYESLVALVRASGVRPDFLIGENYIRRWWMAKIIDQHDFDRLGPLMPHTRQTYDHNLYLHHVTGSDDDRAPHDHPWPNVSLVLEGEIKEHTPIGDFIRRPGDIVYRGPEDLHWLELLSGEAWTLFLTGRKVRDWGFRCPDGRWIPWKVFCGYDPDDPESWKKPGPGCGEL